MASSIPWYLVKGPNGRRKAISQIDYFPDCGLGIRGVCKAPIDVRIRVGADCLIHSIVVAVSLALVNVNPDSHDFSIADLSLSYAHRETPEVPLWLLIVLAVIAPAVTIVIVSVQTGSLPAQLRLQRLNDALLGLGISLGSATVILNIKNLAGKPRPDFLAICQPDLHNIAAHKVGGYGSGIDVMVYRTICQQPDHLWLNDAFRSFPSGYSTGKHITQGESNPLI